MKPRIKLRSSPLPVMASSVPIGDEGKFWDIYRDGVTQSLITKFLECPEKLRLGVCEGYSSVRFKGALAFGNVVHAALDKAYSSLRDTGDVGNVSEYLSQDEETLRSTLHETPMASADWEQEVEEIYAVAEVLLKHYFVRWEKDRLRFEWVSLEQEFSMPYWHQDADLRGMEKRSIPIRGKIDGIFRANKKLWGFETKTKGVIEEDSIVDRLNFDLQVCLYLWVLMHIYKEPPGGMLYNVMRKPQLRRKAAETLFEYIQRVDADIQARPDFYFMRFECAFTRDELLSWQSELDSIIKLLIMWARGDYHFKNPGSCQSRYGACEFLPVCSRGDFSLLHRRTRVFPELPGMAAEGSEK